MKKTRLITASSVALMLLSGCTTVEIWQPPAGASQAGKPAVTVQDLSTGAGVSEKAKEAEPESQPVSFGSEYEKLTQGNAVEPMAPGFFISGSGKSGDDPAIEITLSAKSVSGTERKDVLSIRIPTAMADRVSMDAASGISSVSRWMTSGGSAVRQVSETAQTPSEKIFVRVHGVNFAGQIPGIVIDIGNQPEKSRRDFVMALRESDADFVTVESAPGTAVPLRTWVEENSDYRFKTARRLPAPMLENRMEVWQAFTFVRAPGGTPSGDDESVRESLSSMRIKLLSEGLTGDGRLITPDGGSLAVHRCDPAGANGIPRCGAVDSALQKAMSLSDGNGKFIELPDRSAIPGVSGLMLITGGRLLTVQGGRLFFWKMTDKSAEAESGAAPLFMEKVTLDTTQNGPFGK